jgi:hypothetical protein
MTSTTEIKEDVVGEPIDLTVNMDLTGADVVILARNLYTGEVLNLDIASIQTGVTESIVTHLTGGALPVAEYDLEVKVSRAGQLVRFPDNLVDRPRLVVYSALNVTEG